jgi:phosphatidate cytidylyltransferase
MLAQRVLSAIVGIPLVLVVTYLGGIWFAVAVALILLVATSEFHLASRNYSRPLAVVSALLAAAFGLIPVFNPGLTVWALLATLMVALPLIWALFTVDVELAVDKWAFSVASIGYVGVLGSHFTALRTGQQGLELFLLALVVPWVTDTGAYTIGRMAGRHKLAPKISPGKTVEGAVAGFVVGSLATVGIWRLLQIDLSPAVLVALALLLPVLGQLGDLAESLLKRGLHIKDSSTLIPGHGGFLDRLDSILFTAITVFYLTRL